MRKYMSSSLSLRTNEASDHACCVAGVAPDVHEFVAAGFLWRISTGWASSQRRHSSLQCFIICTSVYVKQLITITYHWHLPPVLSFSMSLSLYRLFFYSSSVYHMRVLNGLILLCSHVTTWTAVKKAHPVWKVVKLAFCARSDPFSQILSQMITTAHPAL